MDSLQQVNDLPSIRTLKEFTELKFEIEEIEKLKSQDLSEDEIQLYFEYLRGAEYLQSVHRNIETQALLDKIKSIVDKVKSNKWRMVSTSSSSFDPEKNNKYSIDPMFQLTKKKNIPIVPPDHPINHLEELEEDIFGHMSAGEMPSASKRRKLLRRMQRKLTKDIEIPEPSTATNHTSQQSDRPTHCYNEFIQFAERMPVCLSNEAPRHDRTPNSKWDIKDMKQHRTDRDKEKPNKITNNNEKIIGPKPQTLYTIKDNKIMRLETKSNEGSNKSHSNTCYEAVDVKIPVNKAEEKLLEGSRLTLDDIRSIPRFENYQPGPSTNVLYIKNISKQITEEDLLKLFVKYDAEVKISLLSGKMRGQAFATFQNVDNAVTSLNNINGTIVKGKPLVIQYGKRKDR